jgi:asparagine synthase (glutamine-hydrolysing)
LNPEVTPSPETLETFFPPEVALPERMQTLLLYTEVKCHLHTMDRLSAPTGVKVAVPLLSAHLLDLVGRIPSALKNRGGFSKPILRQLGARYFPRDWMYRPKYGFETPTKSWLSGPLRPFLEILREPRTLDRGIFRREVLDKLDLQSDWELLWTAACLEALIRFLVEGEDGGSSLPELSGSLRDDRT